MLPVAERVSRAHYAIRDQAIAGRVAELRKKGRRIIELNIGDPCAHDGRYGFSMPSYMKAVLVKAVQAKGRYDGYANEQGEPELREAVAKDAKSRGIADAKPENVIVGNGLSELIDYFFGVILEESRNVVLPKPDYPLYTARARWYGGEVRYYSLQPDAGWQPDFEELQNAIDEKTAAVVLINPNNPTGSVLEKDSLRHFLQIVAGKGKNAVVLSDEIYHKLRFGGRHVPTACLGAKVPIITMDGMSKGFFSPGWRIGHMLFSNFGDNAVFQAMLKVCTFRLSANKIAQHAYAEGIRGKKKLAGEFRKYLRVLKERAKYTEERLNSISGISCTELKGAFYAFPKVKSERWKDDKEFCAELLEKEGMRVVPGSGFAMDSAAKHFRVVTLPDLKTQKEAYGRLGRFVEG